MNPLCAWAMLAVASLLMLATTPERTAAASAEEIDIKADATLARFRNEVSGADEFLRRAPEVLVFPRVIKAGLGIGDEYGEGALRVAGKTVACYNTAAALLIGLGVVATSLLLDRPPENATAPSGVIYDPAVERSGVLSEGIKTTIFPLVGTVNGSEIGNDGASGSWQHLTEYPHSH